MPNSDPTEGGHLGQIHFVPVAAGVVAAFLACATIVTAGLKLAHNVTVLASDVISAVRPHAPTDSLHKTLKF
jgi:hypothetical protein